MVRLDLPPLRERLEDLPALAAEILRDVARSRGSEPQRLSPEARERLLQHDWPGNVRELRNVLESASIAHPGPEIPAEAVAPGTIDGTPWGDAVRGRMTLAQLEERYIREVLRWTRGHRTEAARILGINRKTLLEKRKRYRIP